MSRYIDADKFDIFTYTKTEGRPDTFDDGVTYVLEQIDMSPTADVEPVRHGYWEKECRSQIIFPDGEVATLIERKCSNCHLWSDKEILKYYPEPAERCSKCGAKMDGKEAEG